MYKEAIGAPPWKCCHPIAAMSTSVNGDVGPAGPAAKFPEIVLDTTLAELLAEEPDWKINESLCNIKPCADPRHTTLPLNHKYLITSSAVSDADDLAHLLIENVSYLLSFWAGHMEVYLMACKNRTNDQTLTRDVIDANAQRAFSVLNEKQRPWVT